MPLYSDELLNVVPPGEPEENTIPIRPLTHELFGTAYMSGLVTKLRLDRDDFVVPFPPGKMWLHLTRKDAFEAVRDALGAVYPFSLILSCRVFPYPNLKPETRLRVSLLLNDNYVVVPYWLRDGIIRFTCPSIPLRDTPWSAGMNRWDVKLAFVGGKGWKPVAGHIQNLEHWFRYMLRNNFAEHYHSVVGRITDALETVAFFAEPGSAEGEPTV